MKFTQVYISAFSDRSVTVINNGIATVRLVNVDTGEVKLLISDLDGAIVLAYFNHRYYVGTWRNGQIHVIDQY